LRRARAWTRKEVVAVLYLLAMSHLAERDAERHPLEVPRE
jgi:hypothetical protein